MKRNKAKAATIAKRTRASNRHGLAGHTPSKRDRSILKLLIVLDASEASARVLQYVGEMLGERDRVEFNLAYIAPHMPAQFLESGGSELPEREMEIESDLRAQQNQWTAINDTKPDRYPQSCAGDAAERWCKIGTHSFVCIVATGRQDSRRRGARPRARSAMPDDRRRPPSALVVSRLRT